jgi:hypothetical protein
MRNFIILTLILFFAVIGLTVKYFSALQPRKQTIEKVMGMIPEDATLIFEFNNDKSFEDIFKKNELFTALLGHEKTAELVILRDQLLKKNLELYFSDQRILISLHPQPKEKQIEFLLSTSTSEKMQAEDLQKHFQQLSPEFAITAMDFRKLKGFRMSLPNNGKDFFLLFNGRAVIGSFSRDLVEAAALQSESPAKEIFKRLSDQQISNSVANLYINYKSTPALLNQLFKTRRSDVFQFLTTLPGTASLSLNYKTDAIMFNGFSSLDTSFNKNYYALFLSQKPFKNTIKSIFPYTTAYSLNFALAEPGLFQADLEKFHQKSGLESARKELFNKIKTNTGVDIQSSFTELIDHEFAIVTTDRLEKIGLVKLTNGMTLKPYLDNISKQISDDVGQLDFEDVPLFLLGDAFKVFKKPYFTIIDNNLIIANSLSTINKYLRIYQQREFLSLRSDYQQFDALQAEQSNISFFIHFRNAKPILKSTLKGEFSSIFDDKDFGWKDYYGASYQFTASDQSFYTNLYMRLNEKKEEVKTP